MTRKYMVGIRLTAVQFEALTNLANHPNTVVNIKMNIKTRRRFIVEGWVVPVRDRGYAITEMGLQVYQRIKSKNRQYRYDNICPRCGLQPRAWASGSYCKACAREVARVSKKQRKLYRLQKRLLEKRLSSPR